MRKLIASGVIALIFIIFMVSSCTRIDAGHEGILVKQYGSGKGVQDVSLVTGRVWYNPLTEDVFEFPTFVQTADYDPFTVNAKDGSEFTVDPTISFFVQPGKSPHIFSKYRKDIEQITTTTLFNYVKDAFRIQMNKYTTDELISNREKFEADVQNTLNTSLIIDGFKLEQLTSGLKYPGTIVDAVNNKNKAVQQAMQVENELKVAEARAKIKLVDAQTEAKANELRQRTLTPMLIQQQFIEKWDGKTPLYGNSPVLFQNIR
jgi:regulator of protease activity HflC (stomatin/prohibitin superfamily)